MLLFDVILLALILLNNSFGFLVFRKTILSEGDILNLRGFGKNAIVYSIGTIVLRASSFLLIPLYTHYLSLTEYGILSTLLLTIQLMITIVDFGIRSALMRFNEKYQSEKRVNELLGNALLLNLTGGVIVTMLMLSIFEPVFRNILHVGNVNHYLLLTCLAAISQSLCVNIISYFRAQNNGIMFMVINLAALFLLITGSIIFLIILKMGISGILISQIIAYSAIWILISLKVFIKNGIAFSRQVFFELFKYGFPLIFATAGNMVMNTTAVYFLGYFSGMQQVAIYSLAFKIASIAEMSVILPFQLAYEPFVFGNLDKPDIRKTIAKLATYLCIIFTFIGFIVVFAFRDFMKLAAPPEYYGAYQFIFLLLPGLAAQGLQYIGQSLLHIEKKTHITGITVSGLTIISVAFNYFAIQEFGVYGVILVFNIIMFSIAIMLLVLGIKTFSVKLEMKRLLVTGVVFLVLLASVYLSSDFSSFLYYSSNVVVLVGIISGLYLGNFLNQNEKSFLSSLISPKIIYLLKNKHHISTDKKM